MVLCNVITTGYWLTKCCTLHKVNAEKDVVGFTESVGTFGEAVWTLILCRNHPLSRQTGQGQGYVLITICSGFKNLAATPAIYSFFHFLGVPVIILPTYHTYQTLLICPSINKYCSVFVLSVQSVFLNNFCCVHHVITNYISTWSPSNPRGVKTKSTLIGP